MEDFCKYKQEKKQVSNDGGTTWIDVVPSETRQGELIECNSLDCGYINYQYRWYSLPITEDFMCSNFNKYYKEVYQQSTDGVEWVDTSSTRRGDLYELNSPDCGYPIYQWINVDITEDWECVGYDKYYIQKEQVSNDGGTTWVDTSSTRTGDLYEANSISCGYIDPSIVSFTISGNRLQLRIYGGAGTTIYNGEGGSATIQTDLTTITHNYQTTGEYTIILDGSFTNWEVLEGNVISVNSWGNQNSGYTQFNLTNRRLLTSIADDLYGGLSNVTTFNNAFNGSAITSIPDNLFKYAVNATNFVGTFYACSNLTSIPTGLFDNCTNATGFGNSTSPSSGCFGNCKSLTGVTPTTNGLELWERGGQTGYPETVRGPYCFRNCTGLSNYSEIPSSWIAQY